MASILFITHVRKDNTSGVWKKVLAQRDAFSRLGLNVDFVYEDEGSLVVEMGEGSITTKYNLAHRYLFFYVLNKKMQQSYDFVYIRKPHGGLYPLYSSAVINKLKKINANCRVYLEIPTYPYKQEQVGLTGFISDLTYRVAVFLFRKNIEEILFIGEGPEQIDGIKTRKITNGVNLDSVVCDDPKKKENEQFVFAGIANLMFWHGYDRLITSLRNYTGKHDIKCYIIGDSEPELSRLKSLAIDRKLTGKIVFTGRLADAEIKNVLRNVNVCVDALGRHRSGNNVNSSIKSKEYVAMGLPFIKSHVDDSFNGNEFFIYQVPADESDIPFDDIIKWYYSLPADFPLEERKIAEERFSWDEILRPVFELPQSKK